MKQHTRLKWTRLENASRIFPAVCNNKDTKVFRLTCELNEAVVPEILQQALDTALEDFPLFHSVLRRGVFWYYLEDSDIRSVVSEESNPVCAPIYFGDRRNLLFRLFYFRGRINFEVFHALTDGTGAISFMKTLVYEYLRLRHVGKDLKAIPLSRPKAAVSKKMDDSFKEHFAGSGILNRKRKNAAIPRYRRACRIQGSRLEENRMRLIEGVVSVRSLLDLAHEYNTTITVFLASVWLCSINSEMPLEMRKRPVVLSVPVDLRNFFVSATARNFFSTMYTGYRFENREFDLENVIKAVGEAFRQNLTEEELHDRLNRLIAWGQNPLLRVTPLPLKNLFLRIATAMADRNITSAMSNLGRITMPAEMAPYIRQFTICTSAKRPQMTMCSYLDKAVISFTSPFAETDMQRVFFQFLAQKGLEIEISSNF